LYSDKGLSAFQPMSLFKDMYQYSCWKCVDTKCSMVRS